MSPTGAQNGVGVFIEPRKYPLLLSIVIPMYNEQLVVDHLRCAVERFLPELSCPAEVILVNDGSRDNTLAKIVSWARADERIKVINLSRNFGHQNAATAGLDFASGDAVVLIDADLQDPIWVIHQMIARYCEGYDVVYGQRITRVGETAFKRLTAWIFYRLMKGMVYKDLPTDAGDFRLMSQGCLDGLRSMRETHRFLRGMVAWVGYPQIGVEYERGPRAAGETKYPLPKMLSFAWTAATSFSILPLRASVLLGVIATLLGMEEAVRATLAHLFHWYSVPGWSSLTVLVSLLGGATLMSVGIVGEYVGKIYEQSKDRPLYLVGGTMNIGSDRSGPASRVSLGTSEYPAEIHRRV
ncbi:MAG TPA: glycosyltransferase family 2 protein [Terriglobales bacterium]|nr:glycosyltransferase family 2 protein [Terriglobales bacterium]